MKNQWASTTDVGGYTGIRTRRLRLNDEKAKRETRAVQGGEQERGAGKRGEIYRPKRTSAKRRERT